MKVLFWLLFWGFLSVDQNEYFYANSEVLPSYSEFLHQTRSSHRSFLKLWYENQGSAPGVPARKKILGTDGYRVPDRKKFE